MPTDIAAGLAGIVLAAGGATRFGAPKQLARIDGVTLVGHAARLALGCCPAGVVVVTGAAGDQVAAAVADLDVSIVHNEAWADGLSASLRSGVAALPPACGACLVLPCDLPLVDRGDLDRLVAAWCAAPERAAAAEYAAIIGVPAIFPASQFSALLRLTGDCGARGVLAVAPAVSRVPMPHAALDVDTPGDLFLTSGSR